MLNDNANLHDQADQLFKQEALELLQLLEDGLLTIGEGLSTPKIHDLMRAAHSIKGGAASLELTGIQKIAHKLEEVFRALYRWEKPWDKNLEELLLQASDSLREPLMEYIQTGQYEETQTWEQSQSIFAILEDILQEEMQTEFALPTSAELGFDLVHNLFSENVSQELERLENLLLHQSPENMAQELRAIAEGFQGIGECVELTGFTEMAKQTLLALEKGKAPVIEIGIVALQNFRTAQMMVLAGERDIIPSEELLALSQGDLTLETSPELNEMVQQPPPLSQEKDGSSTTQDLSLEEMFGNLELSSEPVLKQSTSTPSPQLPTPNPQTLTPSLGERSLELRPRGTSSARERSAKPETGAGSHRNPQPSTPNPQPPTPTSVRVDLGRLERLNNRLGELVTQENSSLLQNQQVQDRLGDLQQRFVQFEKLTKQLGKWMDGSQKSVVRKDTELIGVDESSPEKFTKSEPLLVNLDPLQLESYNDTYEFMQRVLEEIAQMGETMGDLKLLIQQSQQLNRRKQQTLKQARNDLLWARMMPIGEVLTRFPRMVRDLSRQHDKQVRLVQTGMTTLVDKIVLEHLYDPLVHLVRNAFDHGTESPEERIQRKKPAQATIEIRAYHQGHQTWIEIRDDGQGIDLDKIRAIAVNQGLLSPAQVQKVSNQKLYQLLFEPGFSSKRSASELSGRGMGLNIVRTQIHKLKGKISVASKVGKGTKFIIRFPLTLTIAQLLVFSVDNYCFALPVDSLTAIVTADKSRIQNQPEGRFYVYRDRKVPIQTADLFTHPQPFTKLEIAHNDGIHLPDRDKVTLLLIAGGRKMLALEVDYILYERELVIKPFGKVIKPPPYLYGCTILGDGSLAPVLDSLALIKKWRQHQQTKVRREEEKVPTTAAIPRVKITTILVVDDSVTTRQNLALTLRKAGYQVIQASNGRQALEQLQQQPQIQGIFCDVEMPRMNGFEFLSTCRKQYPIDTLPIIMLTSRNNDKFREIATVLGANAYLTKPYLKQNLLNTLQTCLENTTEDEVLELTG